MSKEARAWASEKELLLPSVEVVNKPAKLIMLPTSGSVIV